MIQNRKKYSKMKKAIIKLLESKQERETLIKFKKRRKKGKNIWIGWVVDVLRHINTYRLFNAKTCLSYIYVDREPVITYTFWETY